MTREVTDEDGTTWSVAQVFAGLDDDAADDPVKTDAARVKGAPDRVHVVCTPTGGAGTVRIQLPEGWRDSSDDQTILAALRAAREGEA